MMPCGQCHGEHTVLGKDGVVVWCVCVGDYGFRYNSPKQRQNMPLFSIPSNLSREKNSQKEEIRYSQLQTNVNNSIMEKKDTQEVRYL